MTSTFRDQQPALDGVARRVELSGREGPDDCELRVGERLAPAQLVEPVHQRRVPPAPDERVRVARDEIARPPHVASRDRVCDRFLHIPVLLEPPRGSKVQHGDALRLRLLEVTPKHVREEMVVPVPLPSLVERDQEEIRVLGPLEKPPRCRRPSHHVTERRGKPREDGGLPQEGPDLVRELLRGRASGSRRRSGCRRPATRSPHACPTNA